ncbi:MULTISPECIES: hypothetical protein [Cysteiniphilum]|uniref:Uncharacterized protein n=1 Tax=Cysteiniphilum litorale TaxID=2056700 RepID=A0A8J2Z306_9GAMM|nr:MULTISPECIES: hypothetical protein [Cysteiniphilum]GGF91371.1 hypothetical protein GCM10010995_05770 [Cysteiniphilum litorale]
MLQYLNYKIEITLCDDYDNPRDWCNLSQMICFHRKYSLGDEHEYNHNDYLSWEELKNALIKQHDIAIIKPIYLYDHSGITIDTTPFHCQLDSGQIGFVFVTKDNLRSWFSKKRLSAQDLNYAQELLNKEISIYNAYLSGSVYGYMVYNNKNELLDSCSGYYDDNHNKSGLMSDAKAFIDTHIVSVRNQKARKLKQLIRNSVPLDYRKSIMLAS